MSLNLDKYEIFFNSPLSIQLHISRILHFKHSCLYFKYLGAPFIDFVVSHPPWTNFIAKLEKHLSNQDFISLNLAVHLILLNFVLYNITSYPFSIFSTPKKILNEIRILKHYFLWCDTKGKSWKWDLVAWNKVCMSLQGGIGTQDHYGLPTLLLSRIKIGGESTPEISITNASFICKEPFQAPLYGMRPSKT